ncbi:hypothetical protein AB4Y44_29185 [Paraburkholderia sp. BR10937]|uniref:hypothetical protein n=1 Tax=Paraburkholderia sp. BR10937 TaxID=3236994 RepID=UPI0034D29B56
MKTVIRRLAPRHAAPAGAAQARQATPARGVAHSCRPARSIHGRLWRQLLFALCGATIGAAHFAHAEDSVPLLPPPAVTSTTVPANGDLNPYGVAFVPDGFPTFGTIAPGDLLVSNFNNAQNVQGTGTTIVKIVPDAKQAATFFQGPPGLGLTMALNVLRGGFVLVGNTPTTDGTFHTIKPGSLIIVNRNGNMVAQWTTAAKINGPWGMTVFDQGDRAKVFVSNVLDGNVVRLDVTVDANGVHLMKATQVASGYQFRGDAAAVEVGPAGLVYDPARNVLYVASIVDNAIFAVFGAGTSQHDGGKGVVIYADNRHLHGALGLALGPNGDLFTSNGDAINPDPAQTSELVEFTPQGQFVAQLPIDPAPDGAFGIAFGRLMHEHVHFAAVDDNTNAVTDWNLPFERQ